METNLWNNFLFSDLTTEEIQEILTFAQEFSFSPQKTIFCQEDVGNGMYLIKTGVVQISVRVLGGELVKLQESTIRNIEGRDTFGASAFLAQ